LQRATIQRSVNDQWLRAEGMRAPLPRLHLQTGDSMAKLLFDHFVVLMLENRSFDHVFGYLGIGDGVPPAGFTNYLKPGDKTSGTFKSRKGGDFTAIGEGPSHSLKQVNEQLFGVTKPGSAAAKKPLLNGFVSSFEVSLKYDLKRSPTTSELQQVMNAFDPVQLPVLSTLAKNFVLCDRWFVKTQIAKHLEHYFASKGKPKTAAQQSTENQYASTSVSPSRIAELKATPKDGRKREERP
jgi:phospholipase C